MPKDVTCVTKVLDFPVLSTNFWRKTAKVLSTKKKVLCRCLDMSYCSLISQELILQLCEGTESCNIVCKPCLVVMDRIGRKLQLITE